MQICQTLSEPDLYGLQICMSWVEVDFLATNLYGVLTALAISPQQALYICTGYASVITLAYLLKQARRGVT